MSLQEGFYGGRSTPRPRIPDGMDVESVLLGRPTHLAEMSSSIYVPFRDALKFVLNNQPSRLERSPEVSRLRSRLAELCLDKNTPVKFFTSIGTPLDTYHGIDGLFMQGGSMATIDISMREKESYKADVLILATQDKEGKVTVSNEEIEHAAIRLSEILNSKRETRAAA